MQQYIIFKNTKIGQSGRRYEAYVKRMITKEDASYYYIGKDKFSKADNDYDVGEVVKESYRK